MKKTPIDLLKEFAPEFAEHQMVGITNAEITEAIMVARYMKQAVVNDTVSNTLHLLSNNEL